MKTAVSIEAVIVVDEDNNWLYYAEGSDIDDAFEQAKHSDNYDPEAKLYAYKVIEETELSPEP